MTPVHAAAEMYLTDPKRAFAMLCNHVQELQSKVLGEWQLCPKCLGQKVVARPSYVPVDAETWASSAVTHQCDICNGLGLLQKPLISDAEEQEISFVKGLGGPDSNLLNPDNYLPNLATPRDHPLPSLKIRDETDIF